jgi:hypothetical protein
MICWLVSIIIRLADFSALVCALRYVPFVTCPSLRALRYVPLLPGPFHTVIS